MNTFFCNRVQLKVMKVLLATILFILCYPEKKEQLFGSCSCFMQGKK
jgi:hypothetical protein